MKKYLFIILSILLCLTGCSVYDKQDSANAVAMDFITSFKHQDFAHMYSITKDMAPYMQNVYNPNQELNKKLFKALSENMEYTITNTEIKGDEANVFYHLRTLDTAKLMAGILTALEDDPNADINEVFEKQIVLCPRIDKDTVINMERLGNTWIIESNVGIYDDLCGGYIQFCYNAGFVK